MAEVPIVVATVMSTAPAEPAGETTVQLVVDEQLTAVPALVPNSTVVAPTTNPVPVMVTVVSPPVVPKVGVMDVTTGEPAAYVNWTAPVGPEMPPAVVTVMSTAPAEPGG